MAEGYVEARVQVPEAQIDAFLSFCEEVLGTMPALNRIPNGASGPEVLEAIENRTETESAPS